MQTLLVTGTDTNVGKTWITCLLVRQLRQHGVAVGAYKPVCSGAVLDASGQLCWTDVDQLAEATGWDGDIDQICPQRFNAAVAPNVAAALEERLVDDEALSGGLRNWSRNASHVVVEGAGGLLCPLSDRTTVADLADRLSCPVLIVAANRLGVINHSLLTMEAAERRGLKVAGIVLNDCRPVDERPDASAESNAGQLQHWRPQIPIYRCRYNSAEIHPHSSGTEFSAIDCFA